MIQFKETGLPHGKLCILKIDILPNKMYHLNLVCGYKVECHPALTHFGKSENTI